MCGGGRSPLGLRGLKSKLNAELADSAAQSQPTRAAWIEIAIAFAQSINIVVAAHSGCVD